MPRRPPAHNRLLVAAGWPVGIALTSWRYLWRTTPLHRWEMTGRLPEDGPPPLPDGVDLREVQRPEDGVGPLVHRIYRTRIRATQVTARELMAQVTGDLRKAAPSEFARFQKLSGVPDRMAAGDDYVVRMPGPWDGPVRVVEVSPSSFRLATLEGHLEAGQITFRAADGPHALEFAIESWARSGDRLSDLLYTHLRMAKETQVHMWTSVLERVVKLARGEMDGGIVMTTRRAEWEGGGDAARGTGPTGSRAQRRLAQLARRPLNFELSSDDEARPENGWRVDDMIELLPHESPGAPVPGGSFEVARRLMVDYQVADPGMVRATYRPDAPLAGRDMLLEIRHLGLRLYVGVRVGEVYDERRTVDGRPTRVFGWGYSTLEGHFEQGRMHYELWKWEDTGDVAFRLHAFSRAARRGPLVTRIGFRLIGRRHQLRFYRSVCRRMRRLTEAQLEAERASVTLNAPMSSTAGAGL
jgi:uncharacterized protein (UPF0548 family)